LSKQEQILEVAEMLFSERGYEGTSVRSISQKAGVNVAMISYYFGSKEKLFAELVEYRASYLREKLEGLNKDIQDPLKRIDLVVDIIVDRILSNPKFHRLVHREITLQQRSEINEHIVDILMKNLEEVRKMIREGVRKKIFRKVDVELLICSLFSTTSQVAQSTLFCSRLFGTNPGKPMSQDEEMRSRLKLYLKDLLKRYLIP
jgi:AcrR family transcriptional regulator